MRTRNPYRREVQETDSCHYNPEHVPLWEMFAVMEHLGLYSGEWWTNREMLQVRTDLATLCGKSPAKFRELEEILAFAANL